MKSTPITKLSYDKVDSRNAMNTLSNGLGMQRIKFNLMVRVLLPLHVNVTPFGANLFSELTGLLNLIIRSSEGRIDSFCFACGIRLIRRVV